MLLVIYLLHVTAGAVVDLNLKPRDDSAPCRISADFFSVGHRC